MSRLSSITVPSVCLQCVQKFRSIFNVLSDKEIFELSEYKTCSFYKKGQYIFTENGLPYYIFCIHSGKVKLFSTGYNGKDQILHIATDGDIFGYQSLIANERYPVSAIALEDSFICTIDKQYFLNLIKKDAKLLFEITRRINKNLKMIAGRVSSVSQKSVRERIAEALLIFKDTIGFADDGQTLDIFISRQEIADYVGTSKETAIRLLIEFKQDGMIELNNKKIKILNLDKLIKTAKLDF